MIIDSSNLLDMINCGYSVNEMSMMLGISNRAMYDKILKLSNRGYKLDRKYYYTGDIEYITNNGYKNDISDISIITSNKDNEFRALLVSDLHIGSRNERMDSINDMYEYCIKNSIHIIINAGDLVNGMIGLPSKHSGFYEQIDYLINNYPFDNNILNFCVLGNHDYDSLNNTGQDLMMVLNNYRHDIVPLGYGIGTINVKNDKIIVQHHLSTGPKYEDKVSSLVLKGHSHKMKMVNKGNRIFLKIPTLSNDFKNGNQMVPSMIEMNIKFRQGYFYEIGFKQLIYMNGNFSPIGEVYSVINHYEKDNTGYIKYEEDRVKKRLLIPNNN